MESNYNMATIFTKKDFNFPCVYKLTSPSGKIYIGQTQCLYRRFQDYRKPKANEYLMKAILKYGLENISVEILEKDVELGLLDEREQFYLDMLQPFGDNGYNICKEASTTRGRKRPKDERDKISEIAKTRIGELNGFYGKTHTEETKQLLSKLKTGSTLNEDHIKKFCGAGQESVKRKVNQICKKTGALLNTWDYIRQASKELKINEGSIVSCCRGRYKSAGGFIWEYV